MSAIEVNKELGGVIEDAELRFSPQGKAFTKVRLGFSDPVFNQETQQWSNVNQFYVEGTAWERTAEQLAEVATKGTQILVWGKLVTDTWEDRETGQKRSKPSLKIKGFRPVGKLPDVGNSGGGAAQAPTGQTQSGWGDQQTAPGGWGGAPSGGGSWGTPQGGEPPF